MEAGDSSNSLMLRMTNHASTHIDVPRHFIPSGRSITDYQASEWIFSPVVLVDVPSIEAGDLIDEGRWEALDRSAYSRDAELVLLRTGFEKHRGAEAYWARSPGLHSSLCGALLRAFPRLRAVGLDCISVSSLLHREEGRAAHREFLGKGLLLVEDMRLSGLKSAPKSVLLSPLLIENGDGAPVTAFAFHNEVKSVDPFP